jgi:hypothetical protein
MNLINFLEIFFVLAATLAMPFIVIGSYFNFVPSDERSKPLTIFFLIISIIYALTYSYIAWKGLKKTDNWKRITEEKKTEEKGKKK